MVQHTLVRLGADDLVPANLLQHILHNVEGPVCRGNDMNLTSLYFSPNGRISRKLYWLASLPLFPLLILIELLIKAEPGVEATYLCRARWGGAAGCELHIEHQAVPRPRQVRLVRVRRLHPCARPSVGVARAGSPAWHRGFEPLWARPTGRGAPPRSRETCYNWLSCDEWRRRWLRLRHFRWANSARGGE